MSLVLETVIEPEKWLETLRAIGHDHLLQSWGWGQFKSGYGWRVLHLTWNDASGLPRAAAQILFRSRGPGLTMGYCPKGPLLDWNQTQFAEQVLRDLAAIGREQGAFFLKIDPDLMMPHSGEESHVPEIPGEVEVAMRALTHLGWIPSREQVQFKNTLLLDLRPDEESLLASMKQKTRYNIRLASRKGVRVRQGSEQDLELLYQMFAETSLRDGFAIRTPDYYRQAWGAFIEREEAMPLIAEFEGDPVAAIIVFRYLKTAYYLYGMSRDLHRETMPNYLLQWEGIRWAKQSGCTTYDMWGAPDRVIPSDPMYGVYKFKEGFGARLVQTQGAYDLPLRSLTFHSYTFFMPLLLAGMRWVGRKSTRQSIDG